MPSKRQKDEHSRALRLSEEAQQAGLGILVTKGLGDVDCRVTYGTKIVVGDDTYEGDATVVLPHAVALQLQRIGQVEILAVVDAE